MLDIQKTYTGSGIPVWQGDIDVAQGGFTLDDAAFAAGVTVPAGTPIGFDESTRIAKVAKVAQVTEDAANNATQYKIKKNSNIVVGSSIKSGASAAKSVTAKDTTNAAYDLITVATTLGVAVTTGDTIFIDDAGYSGIKGLSYEDVVVGANGIASLSVVMHGTVYARRITPVPAGIRAKLPLIIFSESF